MSEVSVSSTQPNSVDTKIHHTPSFAKDVEKDPHNAPPHITRRHRKKFYLILSVVLFVLIGVAIAGWAIHTYAVHPPETDSGESESSYTNSSDGASTTGNAGSWSSAGDSATDEGLLLAESDVASGRSWPRALVR